MSNLNLKSDFLAQNRENWRQNVDTGLRGGSFESLLRHTEDNIKRGPLMTEEDLPESLAPLARTNLSLLDQRNWHIAAPVRDPDIEHANKQLLEDLKGGASFVRIENKQHLKSKNDLKRLLEGVYLDLVPLQFAHNSGNAAIFKIAKSIKPLQKSQLALGLDPIEDAEILKSAMGTVPPSWRLMGLNASQTHEQGGTDVQELSILAASVAEAMRLHGAQLVCDHLVIDLAADRDPHLTIAKFRTARRLVRRIANAFGVDGTNIPICAVTSLRMMQTEDAWTNLLRVMSAGFGAIVGGADAVTTRPFTDNLGQATPFAHRIARNMQLMMMEESHLGQVSDAAFGSFWHERVTEDLAQAAWIEFQNIETAGGARVYLGSSAYQDAITASKQARAERDEPILGVTLHPAEGVKKPKVRS